MRVLISLQSLGIKVWGKDVWLRDLNLALGLGGQLLMQGWSDFTRFAVSGFRVI